MICEEPCKKCGAPLSITEKGEKSSMTYVDQYGIRRCLLCGFALTLEDISEVDKQLADMMYAM